eukprot:UN12414
MAGPPDTFDGKYIEILMKTYNANITPERKLENIIQIQKLHEDNSNKIKQDFQMVAKSCTINIELLVNGTI